MRIGIVGGGSIGLLYAYYLNQMNSVTIYTKTKEQADIISLEGLWLKDVQGNIRHTAVSAAVIGEWAGTEDMTIITVKQYQLQGLIRAAIPSLKTRSRLLFLQNGMGHLKLLNELNGHDIYVGTVDHGAYRSGPNRVDHNGLGITKVAVFRGDHAFIASFAKQSPTDFPFIVGQDYYGILVRKLVVNAVINPLTAVLKVENGALTDNPYLYSVAQRLFSEIAEVLRLEDRDEYFQNVVNVCKKTAKNRSSMLKDIEQKRETEIDAILGFLMEEASSKGFTAPLVHTFYQLVKGEEYRGDD